MRYEKVFISVIVKFLFEGGMRPTEIIWTDGSRFSVERIKFIEKKPCRTGGVIPLRYTVIIEGLEKYLYYLSENERWFIEKRIE